MGTSSLVKNSIGCGSPSSNTRNSSCLTLLIGRLLRSITRTFKVTNSVLTLTTLSGSISSLTSGVGLGFGLSFGGGGGSPKTGATWPSDVGLAAGVGVAVGVGCFGTVCELLVLETGVVMLIGVGVAVGFATALCVLRRGRESGSWEGVPSTAKNDTSAASTIACNLFGLRRCPRFTGILLPMKA